MHGVQSKPGYAAKASSPTVASSAAAKQKDVHDEKKDDSIGGGLFQFFKSSPATATKSEKPPPPAPPAPPKPSVGGDQSKKEQQQQSLTSTATSWINKAFQFTEGFTKSSSKVEEKAKKFEDKSSIVNGAPFAPPPAPYIIKTTPVPSPPPPSSSNRLDEHLRNQPEPRYPAALGGSEDTSGGYSSKSTLFVRTSAASSVSPPSPPIAPEVTVGQATVQIHVKPSFKSGYDYQSSSSNYTRSTTDADHSRTAVWTPAESAPISSEPSYYTRTTPKASPTSQTTMATEDASLVQKRRRQWPPPSNATGVDVSKDMWQGTGSVADLDAAEAPESHYQSYTETTSRDFGSRPSTFPVTDSTNVVDELAATVTAAALRSKFHVVLYTRNRVQIQTGRSEFISRSSTFISTNFISYVKL